jgi:predicted house-cleaning noncanonical NTP pyrophosphatase (MazG superfamily)
MKSKIFFGFLLLLIGLFGYFYCFSSTLNNVVKIENMNTQMTSKMRKFLHNKLWRDKGPARMEAVGSIVHVTVLNDEEYNEQLGLKLLEEAAEVHTAKNKEELISEVGDVLEVLDCIIALHNLSREEIEFVRDQKREERGSLLDRQFVTYTESIPGSFLDIYCSKDPDKYIEILD